MGKRPVKRVTKPRDTDGDGLSDAQERKLGTNPRSKDTDRDGIQDHVETLDPKTDPRKADTDGDGLSDFAEMSLGLDANDLDSDDDGWKDGYEVGSGSDAKNAASVPPGLEDVKGSNATVIQQQFQTAGVGVTDTDHDGLSDEFERTIGTNAKVSDTDNDGLGDQVEYLRRSNPKSRGRIDPADNYDLNRALDGEPLPLKEQVKKNNPNLPSPPEHSDAGDAADLDGDVVGIISDRDASELAEESPIDENGWRDILLSGDDTDIDVPPVTTRAEPPVWDEEIPGDDPVPTGTEVVATSTGFEPPAPAEGGVLGEFRDSGLGAALDDGLSLVSDDTSLITDEPIA
jgi:hypothetical protein